METFPLQAPTPSAWVDEAVRRWPELLSDHANCEKKAASTALALMFAYPEDRELASRLSRLAREELRHRLEKRGTETPEVMARRLATAEAELAAQGEFDVVVVNRQLESACAELISLLVGNAPESA